MLHDLAAQDSSVALARRLRRYTTPTILAIDEVGYLSYDARYADLLFEVVTRRYQNRPILLTTNKVFGENWLFSWTELGARHVGIVQSLLVTCRLHDIDPYDYFVDVLQRVGQHPASPVDQLTPRLWKPLFAANPLRSDLYGLGK